MGSGWALHAAIYSGVLETLYPANVPISMFL